MGSLVISIPASTIKQTSFQASVTTTGSVAMQHNWYLDDEIYTTIKKEAGQRTSTCSFSGLSPGTRYKVSVRVFKYNPWQELDNGTATVTTKESPSGPKRPDDWEWWSNGISEGLTLRLTAAEWNGFIERIQAFANYKGVSLNASTLSAAAAESGRTRMASQANAVRSLVNQLRPSIDVPSSVSPGEDITADFVNGLMDSLNSIT